MLAVTGCGDDDASGGGAELQLVVSAAASMKEALSACSPKFEGARVRLSFAGSDELAGQIRRGIRPDVFAAANTKLPAQLSAEGLLQRPVRFATNELVVAIPRDSEVGSVEDLAEEDVTLAIGSRSVPVGSYTREVLGRLPEREAHAILANVRSEEPDVKGVVGKLTQGAVDAGFVYESDVKATGGDLRSVALPDELQPTVVYAAGIVKGSKQPEPARRYIDGLVEGACAKALRDAGFGPLR